MTKKFFDIIPPKAKIEKKIETIPDKPKRKRYFLKSLGILVILLILIGFVGSFFFSKVKVEIWPKTEILVFEQTITLSAQLLSDQKFVSQEFSASGKVLKEGKAKGIITVYNAYSTSARTLIPSRFVSADGKLFWSVKRITIPGASYQGGKLVPGEKEVEVKAAEPGEDYDIGPSTFALPALAGTALYTTIYARSFSPMTGGFVGEVSQITQEDLDKAKSILIDKLEKESKEFLKTSISSDLILLDETISQQVIESKGSHDVGTEAEKFNFEVKIESDALAIKKSDMENFAKSYISLNIEQGQRVQEESTDMNYSLKGIDLETETVVLDLEIKAKIYKDIDLDKVKKALLGKSIKQAKMFLENLPEVFRIELKSWPFLKKKIPEDMNKLEVLLRLD